ncbi:MAG: hypothetical protein CMJ18_11720 [Phycisphaeraceae bacterium]|nr:hypothetical protein [Phycisphaeraceae bacterium]
MPTTEHRSEAKNRRSRTEYQLAVEIQDDQGRPLGQWPIRIDWKPAVEHLQFAAIAAGRVAPVLATPDYLLEPEWLEDRGAPWVQSIRISIATDDGRPWSESIPVDYFRSAAEKVSSALVDEGRLESGQTFEYRTLAFVRESAPPGTDGHDRDVVEEPLVLDIADADLASRLDRSTVIGAGDPDDVPVLIRPDVLEETRARVREAGEVETGGVLLGRLARDAAGGRLCLEITAQVPARHTRSASMKLTFTHETWSDARAALQLRQSDEIFVGWWHSHPDWCRKCPSERQEVCPLRRIFFSTDDCSLHRTVFPRAYQVGLLLTDRTDGIIPTLFGWRRGMIRARAFHVDGSPEAIGPADAPLATIGGHENAPTH